MSIIHTWLKRLLIAALVSSIAMLWGELFTRILLPQLVDARMNILQSDDELGVMFKPSAITRQQGKDYNVRFQINSIGLRDREYGPKKKNEFRVLLLGDSVSESHGVPIEESISRQLERSLQRLADQDGLGLKIEVINAARGGSCTYDYWKAYGHWKSILNPDLVFVTISPDDYETQNAYLHYIVEDGEIIGVFREGQKPIGGGTNPITKLRKWLSWNSEFYILLRNYFYYDDKVLGIIQWLKNSDKKTEGNPQMQQYLVPQPESIKQEWSTSLSFISNLKMETNKDGISLILMSVPMKMEIDSEDYRRTLLATGLKAQQLDVNQPLRELTDFCKKYNISLLDPRTALRKRHSETPCHFAYDPHWNAEGLHTASETVALQWRQLQLPPWKQASH